MFWQIAPLLPIFSLWTWIIGLVLVTNKTGSSPVTFNVFVRKLIYYLDIVVFVYVETFESGLVISRTLLRKDIHTNFSSAWCWIDNKRIVVLRPKQSYRQAISSSPSRKLGWPAPLAAMSHRQRCCRSWQWQHTLIIMAIALTAVTEVATEA